MRYRKKPIEVEAIEAAAIFAWMDGNTTGPEMPDWVKEAARSGLIVRMYDGHLTIKTLEGDHTASPSDMVIQGIQGELYPCKPDIFAESYDPVED